MCALRPRSAVRYSTARAEVSASAVRPRRNSTTASVALSVSHHGTTAGVALSVSHQGPFGGASATARCRSSTAICGARLTSADAWPASQSSTQPSMAAGVAVSCSATSARGAPASASACAAWRWRPARSAVGIAS